MSERRRSARSTAPRPAQLKHREHWSAIIVSDLSRHGARMCGAGTFKVGDHVIIELAASAQRLGLHGRVVWNDHSRHRHAGVEFDALGAREQTVLDGVLFEEATHEEATHVEEGKVLPRTSGDPADPARRR